MASVKTDPLPYSNTERVLTQIWVTQEISAQAQTAI